MTGLALTQLSLSHFRSHKRSVIDCGARPIAIYGPNGAGKTNILEAVSLFSPGRGLRRTSAEDMGRRPEALGWKLAGVLQSLTQVHEVEIWSQEGGARQLRIDGKNAPQIALGRIARILWLIPAMDRLWIEGTEGRRRFLDRMTLSFFPAHAEASLTYEKAMRERNRLLKDQIMDARWYDALEEQMAAAGVVIVANRLEAIRYLEAAQSEAGSSFPAADLVLEHPDGDLPGTAGALAGALRQNRSRDMSAGRTLVGPHRSDLVGTYSAKGVAARDCSTGEQKALLISLILANARALAREFGAPPILLLDEVAAHLDENRRAALYDEIVALGAQAWMTGTEPGLFEPLQGRATFLRVTEENGLSSIAPDA